MCPHCIWEVIVGVVFAIPGISFARSWWAARKATRLPPATAKEIRHDA